MGDEFEEGRPVRQLLWSVQVRSHEKLGEWQCRHGGGDGKEESKLESIYS